MATLGEFLVDLANRRVTTELTEHSLDDVLSMLAKTMHARYVRTGQHVTFTNR